MLLALHLSWLNVLVCNKVLVSLFCFDKTFFYKFNCGIFWTWKISNLVQALDNGKVNLHLFYYYYYAKRLRKGFAIFIKPNNNCYYCIFLEGLGCRIHSLLAQSRALSDQLTNQRKCINHKFNWNWLELHIFSIKSNCILNAWCKITGWEFLQNYLILK